MTKYVIARNIFSWVQLFIEFCFERKPYEKINVYYQIHGILKTTCVTNINLSYCCTFSGAKLRDLVS